jgi:hypothetical protein
LRAQCRIHRNTYLSYSNSSETNNHCRCRKGSHCCRRAINFSYDHNQKLGCREGGLEDRQRLSKPWPSNLPTGRQACDLRGLAFLPTFLAMKKVGPSEASHKKQEEK